MLWTIRSSLPLFLNKTPRIWAWQRAVSRELRWSRLASGLAQHFRFLPVLGNSYPRRSRPAVLSKRPASPEINASAAGIRKQTRLTQAGFDANELCTSPIESDQFISLRPKIFRETTSPRNDYISQDQSIHFCPEETIQGFLRLADHGLILIERCVEYHRYARENAKVFDQPVISWVG
jgi:hypothetical protein